MEKEKTLTDNRLKTPRAAAVAGILFSMLYITSLVLFRVSVPADPYDAGAWLAGGWKAVNLALYLLPFAGIAFLWFIGVLRDRIGIYEDRFFATVFLGSGLLFLAMLFASGAVAAGILISYNIAPGKFVESGIYTFGRTVVYQIVNVYAVKMAGVFMISICTVAVRTKIFPQWIALLGYAMALLLLLSTGYFYWTPLAFPLWVLLVSTYILLTNLRNKPDTAAPPAQS
ncbi:MULTISPECIES: hypothetical protein [Nitrosomonas]|uniref:DUF4386 family protein n=1 Tax=Nitrosomonas communis TaxID=44574 RepID=A0A0F7KGP6_9PROT|nr:MULTISPECIES: hypothetical protein [Nitrosomonas]AKH37974.1 hypothetical protein AAW31_09340 [Nitrosomonas communis]TYP71580.1 hypothetical protein BCL69_11111 [Nitrosomonas communis]UVS59849.1 hypothetical protein NX761_09820 [Nitrosomonas sp. PLL12]